MSGEIAREKNKVILGTEGKWDVSAYLAADNRAAAIKEIQDNKHIQDIVVWRVQESNPQSIIALKEMLDELKKINHIKRIKVRTGLLISDFPHISGVFEDLDSRVKALDLTWVRDLRTQTVENLAEIVKTIENTKELPENIRNAALSLAKGLKDFANTELDKTAQEYLRDKLKATNIQEISVRLFDTDIMLDIESKNQKNVIIDLPVCNLEEIKEKLASREYGAVKSVTISGILNVQNFESLLKTLEDAGVKELKLTGDAGKNTIKLSNPNEDVNTLLKLAKEYQAIKVDGIKVVRAQGADSIYSHMDTNDVKEAFQKDNGYKSVSNDEELEIKLRRTIVKEFEAIISASRDNAIQDIFNDALKETLKTQKDLVKSEGDIDKFAKDFVKLVGPKLKEKGIEQKFDGYKDAKTFFNYCCEYISAGFQKLAFGNEKPWADLENKYKTRLHVSDDYKPNKDAITTKFTDAVKETKGKDSGRSY